MNEQVIPILRVANAADAVAWYERLGFTVEWEHRIEPGWPAYEAAIRAETMAVADCTVRGSARP